MPASPRDPARAGLWLVEYGWSPDDSERVRTVYDAHRANTDRLGAAGRLLLIGTIDLTHAMAVLTDEGAARSFVANDPLVGSEIVTTVTVKRWSTLRYV